MTFTPDGKLEERNMSLEKFAIHSIQEKYPGAVRGGLYKAVGKIMHEYDDFVENMKDYNMHPDCYLIDERARTITCFEVEDYSKLTEEKLRKYSMWWYLFDEVFWTMKLMVSDRYGASLNPVDLRHSYFFHIEQAAKRRRKEQRANA